MGKDLTSEWKAKAKVVDNVRKSMRDQLDIIKIEARKPLTEWEDIETTRIQKINNSIILIKALGHSYDDNGLFSLSQMEENLFELESIIVDDSYDEFELDVMKVKEASIATVKALIDDRKIQRERDAELERLKKAESDRKRKEHEDQLRKEAIDKAKIEIETEAKAKLQRIENEKEQAIQREEESKREAEKSERLRIESESKAKRDIEDALNRARKEEKQKQVDLAREKKRQQDEKEANRVHVDSIQKEAIECLLSYTQLDDEFIAEKIITAIHNNKISNVSINY